MNSKVFLLGRNFPGIKTRPLCRQVSLPHLEEEAFRDFYQQTRLTLSLHNKPEKTPSLTRLSHSAPPNLPSPPLGSPNLVSFLYLYLSLYIFFSFAFSVCCGIRGFPGQGSNRSYSCRPTPQPQQRQIRATSATCTTAHGNTKSLTH